MPDTLDIAPGFRLTVGAGAVPEVLGNDGDWRRARPGDGAAAALLDMLCDGPRQVTRGPFTVWSWTARRAVGERSVAVDQTNESVIVGEAAVVKWATHRQAGPHPATRRIPVLRDAGFTGMPAPLGMVTWRQPDGLQTVAATVDEYLPGAVDGWTWAVDLFAAAVGAPARVHGPMTAVGALVGDLHAALAGTASRATEADARRWSQSAAQTLERACAVSAFAQSRRADILRRLEPLAGLAGAVVIEGHGDLHVGQVLRAGERFVVTDFDGNPVLPAAERALPAPAALDVAGLAQSLAHVAIVTRRHHDLDAAALAEVETTARRGYLTAYTDRLAAHRRSELFDPAALHAYRVQQVLREFVYAAEHLPRWMYVPEAALSAVLEEVS